jgi:hypothetical protein
MLDSLNARDSCENISGKIIASSNRRFDEFLELPGKEEEKLSIRTHLLDRNTGKLSIGRIDIPFREGLDRISRPFLDDKGQTYFVKYDEPLNYRLETGVTVYLVPQHGDFVPYPEILLKERKPVDFALHIDEGKLHLGALYANFYSHKIEGILHLSLDLERAKWDTIRHHDFSEELQKQLRKGFFGIPFKEIMNSMTIQSFEYKRESGFSILINLAHTQYKNRDPNYSHDSSLFASRQTADPVYSGNSSRRMRSPRGNIFIPSAPRPSGSNFLYPQDYQNVNSPYSTAHFGPENASNPMVYKTLVANLDFSLQQMNYALYKTVNPPELDYPFCEYAKPEQIRFSRKGVQVTG